VTQTVTHHGELSNSPVQFFSLGGQSRAVDAQLSIRRKYLSDFLQRKSGHAAESNQRETLQHLRIE
jgi:hypothetical protein